MCPVPTPLLPVAVLPGVQTQGLPGLLKLFFFPNEAESPDFLSDPFHSEVFAPNERKHI